MRGKIKGAQQSVLIKPEDHPALLSGVDHRGGRGLGTQRLQFRKPLRLSTDIPFLEGDTAL